MRRLPLVTTFFLFGCPQPDPATCGGFCGEGTECVDAKCVPLAEEPEEEVVEEDGKGKKRRRGRRGRRGGADEAGGEDLPPFEPVDDSNVPKFSNNRVQQIAPDGGTERLGDRQVLQHMQTLEGRFNKCIATAAEYSPDDLGRGQISFDINVEPSGKVTGVSVQAPKNLRVFGIVPCMRVVVHRSRFPTWDGPSMRVEYSFTVD